MVTSASRLCMQLQKLIHAPWCCGVPACLGPVHIAVALGAAQAWCSSSIVMEWDRQLCCGLSPRRCLGQVAEVVNLRTCLLWRCFSGRCGGLRQYWSSKQRLGGSINCVQRSPCSSRSCHTNLLCVSKTSAKQPRFTICHKAKPCWLCKTGFLLRLETKKISHFSSVFFFSFSQ